MKTFAIVSALACIAALPHSTRAAECPVGYEVAAADDAGESLLTHKTNTPTVQSSLEATFPELAIFFGERPKIASSYQDATNQQKGGATFSADWKGHPIRGIVSCTIDNGSSTVAVIFGRSDASRADWDQLMNPAATGAATAPSAPSATSATAATTQPNPATLLGPDATVYSFPDGTGSITLAQGWTTQAQSAINTVIIKGPNDEAIAIGNATMVNTPNSPMIQMQKRNQLMMQQMAARNTGRMMPPPPPPPPAPMTLIADFTDPVQAMTDLTPQFSKISQSHGGPAITLDEITSHSDLPAPVQGGKTAIIRNKVTRTLNGKSADYVNSMRVDMCMVGNGVWSYTSTGINAPAERFDQEKALMFAILHSEQLNTDVVQQRMQQQQQQGMAMIKAQGDAIARQSQASHDAYMQQQQQRFDDGQAAHQAQEAGYAAHNEQWKSDELQKQRNAADFIETIKGTRTMYDTQTGQATSVDLNYIGGVVDSLNQATLDPNRFVQIPLRDEMYPQPAGH